MTTAEAKTWMERMTTEEIAKLLCEHQSLKQALCAQTLLVPTGTEDWIQRALFSAERLRETERQFRKLVHGATELLEEAVWRSNFRTCPNCMGRKLTSNNESCCICKGTGVRAI